MCIAFGWIAFGRIASIDANGETISRLYDNTGNLIEIADGDDIYRMSYDAFGKGVAEGLMTAR